MKSIWFDTSVGFRSSTLCVVQASGYACPEHTAVPIAQFIYESRGNNAPLDFMQCFRTGPCAAFLSWLYISQPFKVGGVNSLPGQGIFGRQHCKPAACAVRKTSRFQRRQSDRDDRTRASDVTDDGACTWNKRPRARTFQRLDAALYPRKVEEMEGDGVKNVHATGSAVRWRLVASMLVRPRRINCPTVGTLQCAVTRGVGGRTHVEAGMQVSVGVP
jgi:hypothetical protein